MMNLEFIINSPNFLIFNFPHLSFEPLNLKSLLSVVLVSLDVLLLPPGR